MIMHRMHDVGVGNFSVFCRKWPVKAAVGRDGADVYIHIYMYRCAKWMVYWIGLGRSLAEGQQYLRRSGGIREPTARDKNGCTMLATFYASTL
jgi:hypothetical protein